MTDSRDDSNRLPSPSAPPPDAGRDALDAASRQVDTPTVGLTTFAALQHGERFSLATGGGVLAMPEATETPDERPPDHLDDYEIIETLGQGGMGVVYLARQHTPVRRDVALKVLRATLASPRARHRFEAERQAMARLNHPHVAQIFAAGTDAAERPFLVMEHVPGPPITTYCDRHQLDLRRRLALFRLVCSGIQHAHQKGVLHRDIKPSNILVVEVDGQPLPKIIDFGIAKGLEKPLLDDHQATEAGLMGTPGYFSPEMVRSDADIDTRSDVYALGVLLYELLVGVRPFDSGGDSVFEVLHRIVNDDPESPKRRWRQLDGEQQRVTATARDAKPSTFGRQLTADLDAIVLRAIANDRNDRYATAASLSDDVARSLDHEPVEARPVGGWRRLAKLARRHRGAALAGVLLVSSLIAGLVARTFEARRANHEAAAARQVTAFLVDMFEAPDPRGRAQADITARELLDHGAAQLRDALIDQPLIRAKLLDTIGTVYRNLGAYDESIALAQEALTLRRTALSADHLDVAESLDHLGISLVHAGRMADGEESLRHALAIKSAAKTGNELAIAETLTKLSAALSRQDENTEAAALAEQALALREAHLPPRHEMIAETLTELAEAHTQLANHDVAESALLRAVAMREAVLGPDHWRVAHSLDGLARLYSIIGRNDEAVLIAERIFETAARIHGEDSPELVAPSARLGWVYYVSGKYEESEACSQRALAIAEEHPDVNPLVVGEVLNNLGAVAYGRGDWAACEALFEQSRARYESVVGEASTYVAQGLNNIAACQLENGRIAEAEVTLRRAIDIGTTLHGANHPSTLKPRVNLAVTYRLQDKLTDATREFLECLRVTEAVYGSDHLTSAYSHQGLGEIYLEQEKFEQAEAQFRGALEIREGKLEPGTKELNETLYGLAKALRAMGHVDEAATFEARVSDRTDTEGQASPSPSADGSAQDG